VLKLEETCQYNQTHLLAEIRNLDEAEIIIENIGAFFKNLHDQLDVDHAATFNTTASKLAQADDSVSRFTFKQNQMVVITGPRACGKATLLRLIGRAQYPRLNSSTRIIIPSHLRVLHIPKEPKFVRGTLAENLAFGVRHEGGDAELEHILAVCSKLGLSEDILEALRNGDTSDNWMLGISASALHLLSLARAFIVNADFLCLEHPVGHLGQQLSNNVHDAMREFVDSRGFSHLYPKHLRQPKTVVFTSERMDAFRQADLILRLQSPSYRLEALDKDDVLNEAMLSGPSERSMARRTTH